MLDIIDLPTVDRPTRLRNAPMASLLMRPVSRDAIQLGQRLLELFLEAEHESKPRKRQRRRADLQSLKSTISAFAADLLHYSQHEPSEGYCFRSSNREAFSETVATSRQFDALVCVWVEIGFIEKMKGFQGKSDFDGEIIRGKGWATRYRATETLRTIASKNGITPGTIKEHYKAETGKTFPIQLRAKKLSRGVGPGRVMRISKDEPKIRDLAQEIRDINQFLTGFSYSFGEAPKFRRIFKNGDQQGFDWNWGGRLYCYGANSYQQVGSNIRRWITIDEEATVELDIGSSQLTIAYGLAHQPLPPGDLYEIEGLPRAIVKRLVTAMLGKGGRPSRWPKELAEDYLGSYGHAVGADYKLGDCLDQIVSHHPLLHDLNSLGIDVYRLQYVESQILIKAILALLRASQTPSLPIHDCLIVKAQDRERAHQVLVEEFSAAVGIKPVTKGK